MYSNLKSHSKSWIESTVQQTSKWISTGFSYSRTLGTHNINHCPRFFFSSSLSYLTTILFNRVTIIPPGVYYYYFTAYTQPVECRGYIPLFTSSFKFNSPDAQWSLTSFFFGITNKEIDPLGIPLLILIAPQLLFSRRRHTIHVRTHGRSFSNWRSWMARLLEVVGCSLDHSSSSDRLLNSPPPGV